MGKGIIKPSSYERYKSYIRSWGEVLKPGSPKFGRLEAMRRAVERYEKIVNAKTN